MQNLYAIEDLPTPLSPSKTIFASIIPPPFCYDLFLRAAGPLVAELLTLRPGCEGYSFLSPPQQPPDFWLLLSIIKIITKNFRTSFKIFSSFSQMYRR
jgi:hypothetical protein